MNKRTLVALFRFMFVVSMSTLVLSACASHPKDVPPPAWVQNPPKDTQDWYWGVGEGENLETAKRVALKDIAAKLRVSISGNMESRLSVQNEFVDRTARSKISEDVQKTEFTNHTLEKTAPATHGVFALVKVDRRAFVRETQTKFESANKLAMDATRDLAKKTPIEQFTTLRSALPNVNSAISLGELLRVADSGFNFAPALSHLEMLQDKAAKAANNLVFALQFKPGDEDIAQVLTRFLNDGGMRVANPSEKASALSINISSNAREQILFGSKSLRLQVNLNVQDERKINLAAKQYQINGNSMSDFAGARQDAMRALTAAMKNAGATAALGFKE